MHLLRLAILCCMLRQPLEQRQTVVAEPFRMPLHANDALELTALHGLNDAVNRRCGRGKMVAGIDDGLMVERVDIQR